MANGVVSPVFAGREAELTLLAGAFEVAAGGTPGTVLLGAEAGGGKSRLVGELAGGSGGRRGLRAAAADVRAGARARLRKDLELRASSIARLGPVHVSNILGELSVSTRGEAAAIAHRRHLLDDR